MLCPWRHQGRFGAEVNPDQTIAEVDLDQIGAEVNPDQIGAEVNLDKIGAEVNPDEIGAEVNLPNAPKKLLNVVAMIHIVEIVNSEIANFPS